MYRWSQWLFLTLLDAGLIYRGTGAVDWCDTCETTLATIQVEDGLCWRCHNPVRLIQRAQWYLRLSAYVPENDERLAGLEDWDEGALASQRFVLGRVEGVEIDLRGPQESELTVFTPHADALELARFVLISPKHPAIDAWAVGPEVRERLEELRSDGLERASRDADAVGVIDTGRTLGAPLGGVQLPVLVSPLVDGRFGATAVLGIPERDHSDEMIAVRLQQLAPAPARTVSAERTEPTSAPRAAVRYKADDFSVSRQRSWGTPIPIVYCEDCGTVPVPKDQLPVVLPRDITPTGSGNPLAEREDFVNTTCPSCGGAARRETDTLDCHFDALWLWIPVCVPVEARGESLEEILALADLRHWLPCARVVAGSDSGNFVFDQRIVTKALRDIGPLAFLSDGEPFAGCLFHEMVISDGRKMSKHLGNVVDPDALVERYGADTVRLAVLYAARPQRSLNWSDSSVLRCHRFLKAVSDYVRGHVAAAPALNGDARASADSAEAPEGERDATEHLRKRLAGWCETGVEKITQDMEELEMHSATRNVMRLFDRIRDFEKRVIARAGSLGEADSDALLDALGVLVRLLGPLAPHIAEDLWISLGHEVVYPQMTWPGVSLHVPA
jgi:leucyl-tRNA synthetase